jgi:hypothetical protein
VTHFKVNWPERRMMQLRKDERPGTAKSTKIRVVCEHCNNTWMSRFEDSTKLILSPMIKGVHSVLDISHQEKIVTWLSLRILIGEHFAPSSVITPQEVRRSFKANPRPLSGLRIWTARCGAPTWQSSYRTQSACLSINPNAEDRSNNVQGVSLGIGSVFFYATHTVTSVSAYPKFNYLGRFLQLWPIAHSPMTWPPLMPLMSAEADAVARAFETLADAPNVRVV